MKNKYDSAVVFLYATGNEKLLPNEFRKSIPYSTIATWRKTDYSSYIGNEFRCYFDDAFKAAEIKYKYRKLKRTMYSIARAWIILSKTIEPVLKNVKKDKKLQADMINAIAAIKKYLGLTQSLKLLGLSKNLYQQWLLESKFHCFDSYTALCAKRHPHQLQIKEIDKIKKLITEPELDHWPVVSIASFAMRNKKITASLYSWYKYASLFGIKKKLIKKDQKKIGLIATYPNEYWHVDTTYYPLGNGKKACITIVMDNYSKIILGYSLAYALNFDNVKKAVSNALKTVSKHPNVNHSYLVADGGTENHNKHIDEFISKLSKHKITKIRSLKDIRFSNSPIEAVHRTLKGRYLRNQKFENLNALKKYLKWAVNDYNLLRPHYKHKPKTPYEVYFDLPLNFNVKQRMLQSRKTRIKNNKCGKCIQCTKKCKILT